VRRELLSEDVECTIHILRPLVDDVEVGISFNQTTRGSSHGRAHVRDEETTVRLGTDFISDRRKNCTVALQELGTVWVGGIKVKPSVLRFLLDKMPKDRLVLSDAYLSLQQGEQTATKQGLSIKRRSQVVRVITAGWHISHPQKGSEGIIIQAVCG
jgi:hypothetical protein